MGGSSERPSRGYWLMEPPGAIKDLGQLYRPPAPEQPVTAETEDASGSNAPRPRELGPVGQENKPE